MKCAAIDHVENPPRRNRTPVGAFAASPSDTEIDVTELETLPAPPPWRELCMEIDALSRCARVLDGFDECERLEGDYRALRYLN